MFCETIRSTMRNTEGRAGRVLSETSAVLPVAAAAASSSVPSSPAIPAAPLVLSRLDGSVAPEAANDEPSADAPAAAAAPLERETGRGWPHARRGARGAP